MEENRESQRKTLNARREPTKTHPLDTTSTGFEPGSQRWEARAYSLRHHAPEVIGFTPYLVVMKPWSTKITDVDSSYDVIGLIRSMIMSSSCTAIVFQIFLVCHFPFCNVKLPSCEGLLSVNVHFGQNILNINMNPFKRAKIDRNAEF